MEPATQLEIWKEIFEVIDNTDLSKVYDVEAMARMIEEMEDGSCLILSMN